MCNQTKSIWFYKSLIKLGEGLHSAEFYLFIFLNQVFPSLCLSLTLFDYSNTLRHVLGDFLDNTIISINTEFSCIICLICFNSLNKRRRTFMYTVTVYCFIPKIIQFPTFRYLQIFKDGKIEIKIK